MFQPLPALCGLALLALAAAPLAPAQAQTEGNRPARAAEKGYARVGVGINVAQPLLQLPGGNRAANAWTGIHYRTNWVEMGYLAGRYNATGEALAPTESGAQYYIGGSFPIGAWGLGRRDGTKGMLLMPTLAGGLGYFKMAETTGSQYYLAPALSLQLPYVLIDLRAKTVFTNEKATPAGQDLGGFSFQPQLSLQFDGLWDVFAPRKSYDGHANGVNTTTTRTLVSSDAYSDTYRVSTKSTPYDFDMFVMGGDAFTAIVPHVSTGFATENRGRTLLAGLGVSGRASAFSYDGFVEYGQLGVNGTWTVAPTAAAPAPRKEGEPDQNNPRFGGSRPSGRVLLRGGIDLMLLLQSMAFHSDGGGEGATKFFRVTGGWGPGYNVLPGNYTFLRPEAAAELESRFAPTPGGSNDVLRNEFSDPRLGRGGYCNQWYAQVEIGVASLSVEANRYRNNPLANSNTISLRYLFPYSLLKKAHQRRGGS